MKTSDFRCNGDKRYECAGNMGRLCLCFWCSSHWRCILVFLEKILIAGFGSLKPYPSLFFDLIYRLQSTFLHIFGSEISCFRAGFIVGVFFGARMFLPPQFMMWFDK